MGELKAELDGLCGLLRELQERTQTLYEKYGLTLHASVSPNVAKQHKWLYQMEVLLHNGVDEIAAELGKTPSEKDEWGLRKRFDYRRVQFTQLAERNSTDYLPLKKRAETHADGTRLLSSRMGTDCV